MKRCTACGHTVADHPEGIMGAAINGDAYCHTDDHSCYVAVSLPEGLPEGLRNLIDAIEERRDKFGRAFNSVHQ